jgi:integrase
VAAVRKVEATGDGRFKVRFRYGVSPKTGRPRQTSETFDKKRDAEQFAKWLDAIGAQGALDKLYEGEQTAHVPTLNQVAADHIAHLTGVTEGYRLRCSRLWARTWGPLIGGMPANLVTRDAVAAATNELATRYAAKSLKNQRGLLAPILDRAIEHGHLTANPTKRLRLPAGKPTGADEGDDEDMILLDMTEFDALLDEFTDHYRPVVMFLAGTGCRWGEAVALRKMDVVLNGPQPVVRIRRALKDSPDGRRVFGPPKSKRSKRTIVLPPELVPVLRALCDGKAGTDLVFTAPRGGMVQHRTFWSDHWRPAVWRAQQCAEHLDPACRCGTAHPKRCRVHEGRIPEPCGCDGTLPTAPRIHDLRHTHASWLLANGVRIEVVSARLGHESVKTTWDIYHHLLPDAQVDAARAASLAFRETPPELEP